MWLICFASFAMCCTSHMQLRSFVAHYYDCPWAFHDPACVNVSLVVMEHWEMAGDWKDLCAVNYQYCSSEDLHVETAIWQWQPWDNHFLFFSLSESADLVTVESVCVYMLWWNLGGFFLLFSGWVWGLNVIENLRNKSWKLSFSIPSLHD